VRALVCGRGCKSAARAELSVVEVATVVEAVEVAFDL
jgi:hypothetical protein